MDEVRIKELLSSKGISPSYHRIRIIKYIATTKSHPTIEEIYEALLKEIPTLSKSTIYNNLHVLTEKGILRKVTIPGDEVRYDFVEKPHAHFKCLKCGRIYDIYLNYERYKETITADLKSQGHLLMDFDLDMVGVCKDCLSKMATE